MVQVARACSQHRMKQFATSKGLFEAGPNDILGKGTYGVVYRARKVDDTTVTRAIKTFVPETMDENEGIPSTTLREISALRTTNHPNIMAIEEVVTPNNSVREMFVVMELCKGTLRDKVVDMIDTHLHHDTKWLRPTPQMSLPPKYVHEAKIVVWQLLNALCACHSRGVMHRDIKPANVMWSYDDLIKLGDFGLARFLRGHDLFGDTVTPLTGEVQTLWYRAPEIVLGEERYSLLIDDWSIGCIMAELFRFQVSRSMKRLEPQPLFRGQSDFHTIMLIFEALGTPMEDEYFKQLPYWTPHYPNWPKGNIDQKVPLLDSDGKDLLGKLLRLNPKDRTCSRYLLRHQWFNEVRPTIRARFQPWYRGREELFLRQRECMQLPPAQPLPRRTAFSTQAPIAEETNSQQSTEAGTQVTSQSQADVTSKRGESTEVGLGGMGVPIVESNTNLRSQTTTVGVELAGKENQPAGNILGPLLGDSRVQNKFPVNNALGDNVFRRRTRSSALAVQADAAAKVAGVEEPKVADIPPRVHSTTRFGMADAIAPAAGVRAAGKQSVGASKRTLAKTRRGIAALMAVQTVVGADDAQPVSEENDGDVQMGITEPHDECRDVTMRTVGRAFAEHEEDNGQSHAAPPPRLGARPPSFRGPPRLRGDEPGASFVNDSHGVGIGRQPTNIGIRTRAAAAASFSGLGEGTLRASSRSRSPERAAPVTRRRRAAKAVSNSGIGVLAGNSVTRDVDMANRTLGGFGSLPTIGKESRSQPQQLGATELQRKPMAIGANGGEQPGAPGWLEDGNPVEDAKAETNVAAAAARAAVRKRKPTARSRVVTSRQPQIGSSTIPEFFQSRQLPKLAATTSTSTAAGIAGIRGTREGVLAVEFVAPMAKISDGTVKGTAARPIAPTTRGRRASRGGRGRGVPTKK